MEKTVEYRMAVHYLFDDDFPPSTVAEVMGVSLDFVQEVYEEESRYRV